MAIGTIGDPLLFPTDTPRNVKPPVSLGRVKAATITAASAVRGPSVADLRCGAEPARRRDPDGVSRWVDNAKGNAYLSCKNPAPPVVAPPLQSSPPIVPGAPIIVPPGLVAPRADTGAPQALVSPAELVRMAPDPVAFSPLASAPAVVASTFGVHAEAPDWAWIAGGVAVLGFAGWMLRKKGVL